MNSTPSSFAGAEEITEYFTPIEGANLDCAMAIRFSAAALTLYIVPYATAQHIKIAEVITNHGDI